MKRISRKYLNKIIKEELHLHSLLESNVKSARGMSNRVTRAIMDLVKDGTTNRERYVVLTTDDLIDDEGYRSQATTAYNLDIDFIPGKINRQAADEDFEESDTYLSVSLFVNEGSELHVSGDDINRTGDPGIHLTIIKPVELTGADLSTLRTEISNSVRHEIEHMTQGLPRYYQGMEKPGGGQYTYDEFDISGEPESDRAKDYYLDPKEVSAHIMGYAQNASSINGLEEEIRGMLNNWASPDWEKRKSVLIAPGDVDIIANAWVDWARKHLRSKRFR